MKKSKNNAESKYEKRMLITFIVYFLFGSLVSVFYSCLTRYTDIPKHLIWIMTALTIILTIIIFVIIMSKILNEYILGEDDQETERTNKQVKQEKEYVIITNTKGKKSKKSVCKKCMKSKKRNRKRGNKNYE